MLDSSRNSSHVATMSTCFLLPSTIIPSAAVMYVGVVEVYS